MPFLPGKTLNLENCKSFVIDLYFLKQTYLYGAPDQVLLELKCVFNYNYDLGFVRATVRQAC